MFTEKVTYSTNLMKQKMVKELGINKNTITFILNLYKLSKKIPVLKKSTKSMVYFKNYFHQIKLICRTSENEFKHLFE